MSDSGRKNAQDTARQYLDRGDPLGWFEQVYADAGPDLDQIPWADQKPNPNLVDWLDTHQIRGDGKKALKIGCGLGDDAEELARRGFDTTAFDISQTTISWCHKRFPGSDVSYKVKDLFQAPKTWDGEFDLVLESYTLQVLPPEQRRMAIAVICRFLKPGGLLLVIARARNPEDPEGNMPWPLTRSELDEFTRQGLREISFEDFMDQEDPPVRRFRAVYQRKPKVTVGRVFNHVVLPIIVILLSIWFGMYLYETRPRATKLPPSTVGEIVETVALQPGDQQVVVSAMGVVEPSRQVMLYPQISGEVVSISDKFIPGGRIAAGEQLVEIDARDYELAVIEKKRELASARYQLKLEQGRRKIARKEMDLFGKDYPKGQTDTELALRKPHLESARANLDAAKAGLEKAMLDLSRTRIQAPFDAIVLEKHVDIGSRVSPQTPMALIAGTDTYWVRVSVPVDRLKWIHIPDAETSEGSDVTVRLEAGRGLMATWHGRVIRLLGNLETNGRMARLLVEIQDPLRGRLADGSDNATAFPLLIGAYVHVDILGKWLTQIYALPESALRDGSCVWIMDPENRLDIRPVKVVWQDAQKVLIASGIRPDERLVVSDIRAPVQGMKLMTAQGVSQPSGTSK